MNRGDIVVAALPGDYGKPRPTVIVQADRLAKLDSLIVCPITSDVTGYRTIRVAIEATAATGLVLPSEIMVDKVTAIARKRCRDVVGKLDEATMRELNAQLALVVGLIG